MKKLLILGLAIVTLWSCSIDDSVGEDFYFEIIPIESVSLPEEVYYGEAYTINYTYYRPSTCHTFNDLYYVAEGNFRTLAVINTVFYENETIICEPLVEELEERSFTFYVENNAGTYVFKFWQGTDENGYDIYLVFEVPILQ